MDQTPGPSIARAVLIAANRISAQKLPFPENEPTAQRSRERRPQWVSINPAKAAVRQGLG